MAPPDQGDRRGSGNSYGVLQEQGAAKRRTRSKPPKPLGSSLSFSGQQERQAATRSSSTEPATPPAQEAGAGPALLQNGHRPGAPLFKARVGCTRLQGSLCVGPGLRALACPARLLARRRRAPPRHAPPCPAASPRARRWPHHHGPSRPCPGWPSSRQSRVRWVAAALCISVQLRSSQLTAGVLQTRACPRWPPTCMPS